MYTTDMHNVARYWLNGIAAKSHNGNFRSTGHELWYYNMTIGRTLSNGKKQLLDVTGVNRYSAKTSTAIHHVWSAFFELRRENSEFPQLLTIQPDTVGEYGDFNGWRHFQKYLTTIECRATKQVWKTERGIQKYAAKHNITMLYKWYDAPRWSDWQSGYTFYFQQSTNDIGEVIK